MSETGKVYQVKNVAGQRNVAGKVYQVRVVGAEGESLSDVTSVNGQTGAVELSAWDIPFEMVDMESNVGDMLETLKNDQDQFGEQLGGIEEKIPDNASSSNPLVTKESLGKVVVNNESVASVALEDNAIIDFSSTAMTSLSVALPSTMDIDYVCQLNFSSGSTATEFSAVDAITWYGDGVVSGAFIPAANKRYAIMFFYDGIFVRAVSQEA